MLSAGKHVNNEPYIDDEDEERSSDVDSEEEISDNDELNAKGDDEACFEKGGAAKVKRRYVYLTVLDKDNTAEVVHTHRHKKAAAIAVRRYLARHDKTGGDCSVKVKVGRITDDMWRSNASLSELKKKLDKKMHIYGVMRKRMANKKIQVPLSRNEMINVTSKLLQNNLPVSEIRKYMESRPKREITLKTKTLVKRIWQRGEKKPPNNNIAQYNLRHRKK